MLYLKIIHPQYYFVVAFVCGGAQINTSKTLYTRWLEFPLGSIFSLSDDHRCSNPLSSITLVAIYFSLFCCCFVQPRGCRLLSHSVLMKDCVAIDGNMTKGGWIKHCTCCQCRVVTRGGRTARTWTLDEQQAVIAGVKFCFKPFGNDEPRADQFWWLLRWSKSMAVAIVFNIWRELGWSKAESMVPAGSGVRVAVLVVVLGGWELGVACVALGGVSEQWR